MEDVPSAANSIPDEDVELLRRRLQRAAARICRGPLVIHVEDIVQTALMRVVEGIARGEVKPDIPSSYLSRAAYSVLVDEVRRQRRRREVPMTETTRPQLPPHAEGNPERASADLEIRRGLRDCLAGLIRPRRLAVTMHLQGHSIRESARLLDWPPKRIDNLVYRGLDDLRRCLSKKGITP